MGKSNNFLSRKTVLGFKPSDEGTYDPPILADRQICSIELPRTINNIQLEIDGEVVDQTDDPLVAQMWVWQLEDYHREETTRELFKRKVK